MKIKDLLESKSHPDESSGSIDFKTLVSKVGKGPANALLKHEYYQTYIKDMHTLGIPVAYKYSYHNDILTLFAGHGEFGDKKLRRMIQFNVSHTGRKIYNAHLFHATPDNVTSDGKTLWQHIKSQDEE